MNRSRVTLWAALTAANLLFIWGNSLLPGETSGAISGGIFTWLTGLTGADGGFGELLLRKLGHFTEFACLGALLWRLCRELGQKGIHAFTMPLLGGVLAAVLDETIQVFVPGRGPSVLDVWIDTAGLCGGLILVAIGYHYKRKTKKS